MRCDEAGKGERLEARVERALIKPGNITRFGGLSLGESTHLVNDVSQFSGDASRSGKAFLLHKRGRLTLPVWVDHVGSAGTRYVTGNLEPIALVAPPVERMPRIEPPSLA
jgi:CRISPR-associated protein Cas5t